MSAEIDVPEELRGVTQHTFLTGKDAIAYVREMDDYCTMYGFKLSYTLEHRGNDVWRLTIWIKDD